MVRCCKWTDDAMVVGFPDRTISDALTITLLTEDNSASAVPTSWTRSSNVGTVSSPKRSGKSLGSSDGGRAALDRGTRGSGGKPARGEKSPLPPWLLGSVPLLGMGASLRRAGAKESWGLEGDGWVKGIEPGLPNCGRTGGSDGGLGCAGAIRDPCPSFC